MIKNYTIKKSGFTVIDSETKHSLDVIYKDDEYQGVVSMREQDIQLPLAPWKKGENPFQDNDCYEANGNGRNGRWWFTIRPSSGFTQILSEVESMNNTSWKFWKNNREETLSQAALDGQKCAAQVCMHVSDGEVLFQLVLEDIEGASMGNKVSKTFARKSGISPEQYRGALNNSRPEVDGPGGAKTYLDDMAMKLLPDRDKTVEFRLAATDYVMKHNGFGKYSK